MNFRSWLDPFRGSGCESASGSDQSRSSAQIARMRTRLRWGSRRHRSNDLRRLLLGRAVRRDLGVLPRLEHRLDLGETRLSELAFHAKDFDELAENAGHARGELRIGGEHGRNCLDGTALIEEQAEELIADHRLEGREREAAAGLFAHPFEAGGTRVRRRRPRAMRI